ncbi:hypothetical protein GY45DRAFT_1327650 [Cubamyces sp. BRFM 1775]|nr:hypothetical protein GY45DRAFT_1327650 [Cubamyces sp. BRFM 1775]
MVFPARPSNVLLASLVLHVSLAICAKVTIDNTDSSIRYFGQWSRTTIAGDPQEKNYMGTLSYSNVSGSTATYTFTGTAISVFGGFGPDGTYKMQSQYTIDDGSPTVFTPPSEVKVEQHRVLFFESPQLSPSQHVLVIKNLGEQFFFDYLKFNSLDESTSATNPPTVSGNSMITSQAINTTISSAASQHESAHSPGPSMAPSERTTLRTAPIPSSPPLEALPQSQSARQAASTFEQGLSGTLDSSVTRETPATGSSTVDVDVTTSVEGGPANTSPARTAVPSKPQPMLRAGVIGGLSIAAVAVALGAATYGICFHRQRQRRKSPSSALREVGEQDIAVKAEASAGRRSQAMQREMGNVDMGPIEDPRERMLETGRGQEQDRMSGKGSHSARPAEPRDRQCGVGEALVINRTLVGVRRRSVDGGLRLAGGPLDLGDAETASLSTLPPEYELHPY